MGSSSCQVGNSAVAVQEQIAKLADMKLDDQYLRIVDGMEAEGDIRPGQLGSYGSEEVDRIAGKESLASLGEEGMLGSVILVGLVREN